MEDWKLFKNLKRSKLFVSNYGRVKSINDKTGIESILKLYNRGGKRNQYLCFGYKENTKKVLISIHVAVAELFSERPSVFHQVDHKDNNPLNNKITNLQWLTPRENGIKAHYVF